MGLFSTPDHPSQRPQRRPRLSLLLFLFIIYAGVKLLDTPFTDEFTHAKAPSKPALPILYPADFSDRPVLPSIYHFTGNRVSGNGIYLDLGDRRTHLPASLLSRYFPDELIVPSCLTLLPPTMPASNQVVPRPLPVRDDWPGFYGAPWTAEVNGNLIAILHVYAPRRDGLPIAPPEFQIYPEFGGQQRLPSFDLPAPASFQRGSKAVLYRVFPNGPVYCLDLIVQNGENNGIGHLYYQKYHHYYEMDTKFQIQP